MNQYFIEGNIGVGKSTCFTQVAKILVKPLHPEPVELWRDFHGVNYLDWMNKDPSALFEFQMMALATLLERDNNSGPGLFERSISTGLYCFSKNLTKTQRIILKSLIDSSQVLSKHKRYTIYLRGNLEKCRTRITERGRPEEQATSMAYLEQIHKAHDDWLLGTADLVVQTDDLEKSQVWKIVADWIKERE